MSDGRPIVCKRVILSTLCLAILAILAQTPDKITAGPPHASSSPQPQPSSLIAAPAAAPRGQAAPAVQPARFERITTADGLSFHRVSAILQDHQGFMWFGTGHGLNRYDGYDFAVYKHDPGDPTSIRNDDVAAIFEDSDGTLWIGHGGGLDRFDRETETFTHVDTRGQVFCIYEDSAGTLWVGFWHGLYGYDRATNEMIHDRQPDPDAPIDWGVRSASESAVRAIYEDRRADLWIGTDAGLARLDRETGTFVRYRHDPGDVTSLSSDVVRVVWEDLHGALWIGTSGGLNVLDRTAGAFTRFRHDPDDVPRLPHSLSDDVVTSILGDSAGSLWIGTTHGLYQLTSLTGSPHTSQGRVLHYRHDPTDPLSLSDDTILSLYEDRSGVLWIATTNGINKYVPRQSQFTAYRASPVLPTDTQHPASRFQSSGLSDGRVVEIYEDRGGVLWIGTLLGGLNRLDRGSGQITVYQHDPADPASLSSNTVRAVYHDHTGVLWVGTGNGWLERFDPATGTFVHHLHLGELEVADMAEDPAGNLWIGTGGDGLYRLAPDRETLVHHEQRWRLPDHWKRYGTLSSHITWALHIDRAGALWVGTYHGGINLWDGASGRFSHYRHDPASPNSLSHDYVLSFWEDPSDAVMWIGTMGGLNRLDRDSETFTRYTVEDGLPHDIVGCILGDQAGDLWLGTPKGLSRYDPRTETFRNYDRRDGVLTGMSYPEVCFASRTGEMFFGGADGLYGFDPGQITDNLHVPPVAITAFRVLNQSLRPLPADRQIRLSHDESYLSFEFAALDYTIPEKNQYAYMLEGLDQDWVYAGTRRYVDYPNLRPGHYVFRVKGSNNDGVWNEEGTAVRFTVEPPIWETGLFRAMVALALVAGAIVVYRQRVKNIQARSRELERQVGERTSQLEALYRADEELYRHLRLDQVLQASVDVAVDILQAEKSALLVWDKDQAGWAARAARGFGPDAMARLSLGGEKALAGLPVAGGEPILVQDTLALPRRDGERAELLQMADAEGIRSLMLFPIQVAGDTFGLSLIGFSQARAFSEEERRVFLALAQRASLAIENAQLYEQAQELAAVEERQRLARELHDAVTQTLFSASLISEALPDLWVSDPEQGQQLLQTLRQLSRGALAEMRTLLMELRPAALADADLKDLMRQLAQAVTGREGIPVTVTVEEPGELPPDVHIILYRIAQEALNNVVKHAEANAAQVSLHSGPGQVELCISDDGRGFDPQSVPPECLGLGIMHERAAAIGARLEIESEPGRGTQILVVWEKSHDKSPG